MTPLEHSGTWFGHSLTLYEEENNDIKTEDIIYVHAKFLATNQTITKTKQKLIFSMSRARLDV